jgi:2-polyprenyl-3-methyl-5-hydroxy-6-metoxy-1,4-benzoquinol methylase
MTDSRIVTTKHEWEDLAQLDPLWAILTDNKKQFGRWNQEDFFSSGKQEIDDLMGSCGFVTGNNGRALDFGCGVGRLSRALHSYFAEVYGVDISEEMINLAKKHTPGCVFLINQTENLRLFKDEFFDFVYSNIVLQHQPSKEIAKGYIREFVRIIKPNGIIVFQMPWKCSLRYRLQPRRKLYSLLKALGLSPGFLYNKLHLNPMRTICLSADSVRATVSSAGGQLLRSYSDHFNYCSMSYVVTKDSQSAIKHE